jgi:hypothetical protein
VRSFVIQHEEGKKKVKFMIPARSMLILYDARQQQQEKVIIKKEKERLLGKSIFSSS